MAVLPMHSIYQYSENVYKVITFKRSLDSDYINLRDPEKTQHYDTKLNEAYCRAKSMVLQYALCNKWDYFFTGTLDQRKFNRYSLDTYQSRLSQFIRDKRKAYGNQIQYLLVPEPHEDGAWHIHGLLSGLPDIVLRKFRRPEPLDLIKRGYLNWPDYMYKFGFCSLAPIKHPVGAAFYITKYVSKELSRRGGDLGKHLYFHSRPLKKAELAADVYAYNHGLEAYCVHDHDFCKTGMVQDAPWFFPLQWDGIELGDLVSAPELAPEPDFHPWEIDPFYEQMRLENFR